MATDNAAGVQTPRGFAEHVVRTLRAAGHQALWAGGCVRDALLGATPKDYDVATSALPGEVRRVFGKRRTLPLGEAFGVITVLGPKPAGQIEVATFRTEADYEDGRRPGTVAFTTAEHDASRRDFTINGLFYDPLEDRVIDYVGGRADLQAGVIRAIGDASDRFADDRLRMLRAVRFAAKLSFSIDPATADAIRRHAAGIGDVSAERIGGELRRMLTGGGRGRAARLLHGLALLGNVVPELAGAEADACNRIAEQLERLPQPTLAGALAVLLLGAAGPRQAAKRAMALKFTRKEADRAAWLVEHQGALAGADRQPWSHVQPLLAHAGGAELVALHEATAAAGGAADDRAALAFCRQKLSLPAAELDPPPLVTGDDLVRGGLRPGPRFAELLRTARAAQLDGRATTPAEAMELVLRAAADRP
ncbi:MAG: CCA tRNA nucleotidyltransferase [Planctomycetota bacterium]